MKKLIYTLLLLPLSLFAQTNYVEQDRPLNLVAGWNMIGFTCNEPIDVIDAFLPINDKVIIAKDNNGAVYMPEFGFNGIGFFEYGYGYQLKLTETITDFQFCPAIVPFSSSPFCDCCGGSFIDEECVWFCAIADITCDVEGCTSEWADNYDIMATIDDGSCYRMGCTNYNSDNLDLLATIDDGSCYREGCMSDWADNYDTLATQDTYDVCYREGCMSDWADNFDEYATIDDGSCYKEGCSESSADNYDSLANVNNGTCIWYGCMVDIFPNYNPVANVDDGSCSFEFGCMDETACNYNPEGNMGDESCIYPEQGYDCEDNMILDCMEVVCCGLADPLGLCSNVSFSGCASYMCAQLYDYYVVGMQAQGGIVFYVDSTGQHGLVAAMEDLSEGATIDSEGNPGYQWGCFATWLSGADGQAIGTGYQNTLDIVAGCSETPIAASEALAYELEGYSDWYLPSLDELNEMYNTIGSEGNIGGFSSNWYWSSSESNNYGAYDVNFGDGSTGNFSSKTKIVRVRVIRSF